MGSCHHPHPPPPNSLTLNKPNAKGELWWGQLGRGSGDLDGEPGFQVCQSSKIIH